MQNRRKLIIIVSIAILVLAAIFYFGIIKLPTLGTPLAKYSNPAFGVSFEYPESWTSDPNGGAFSGVPLRFVGANGYFGVDALASDESISLDELINKIISSASTSTEELIAPYGNTPTIESGKVAGRDARIVFPSEDQPTASKNEAIAIIRYEEEIKIGDNFYRYLIIYSHSDYMKGILSSVVFDPPSASAQ